MKHTKEQVYKMALKALSEVDVTDISCRMRDAGEKLHDSDFIQFSDVIEDIDEDLEPKDLSKALYLMLMEAIKRHDTEGDDSELYCSPFLINVYDDGIAIKYCPVDIYVSRDDVEDEDSDETDE